MGAEAREVTVLAQGLGFTEGPVVIGDDVVVTCADQRRICRVDPSGEVTELTVVEGGINGLTLGPGGVLYGAHLWGAHPAPPGPPSTGGVVAWDEREGLRWVSRDPVSPNDLCFGPDGLLYVTDPTRPFRTHGGNDARLWRMDVADTVPAQLLASLDWFANGIAFGPADDVVYVAATDRAQILRLPLTGSGLGAAEVAVQLERGVPDGFAFDTAGNLVVACVSLDPAIPGSIQTWSPDGALLDVFEPGSAKLTNCALTEDGFLFVTASDAGAVLRISGWGSAGLPLHPYRTGTGRP